MKQAQPLRRYLATLLLLAVTTLTWAYDFEKDGIYYDKNSDGTSVTVTYKTSSDSGYSGSVAIPSTVTYGGTTYSVTSISYGAFYGCTGLKSITIPESVTNIDIRAFKDCTGLTSVTIPNSVTSIGVEAFKDCTGLTSVTIPESVTIIDKRAFEDCTGLTSVTIGNSVTSIGDDAFNNTPWYDNQPYGLVYAGKVAYKYKGTMPSGTEIVIKDGTLGIAENAFYRCTGLKSITIPKSVTSISSSAFYNCSGLTKAEFASIESLCKIKFDGLSSNPLYYAKHLYVNGQEVKDLVIPNGVTSIGKYAFYGCTGLTSVTIGNSVRSIGNSAFNGCTGLASVTIGNSVTSIDNNAFSGCSGLTKAEFASIESLCKIDFSDMASNPLYYAKHLYVNGQEVKDLVIPNSVTNIGGYAFYNCSSLTSVTIPESVTSIGDNAFNYCSNMKSLTIPESVTNIGNGAFYNCSSLTSVYCMAEQVPTTNINAFDSYDVESATLYVPASAVDAYKSTEPWSYFGTIMGIDPTAVNDLKADTDSATVVGALIYDLYGRRLNDKPTRGYYIQGGKKYLAK